MHDFDPGINPYPDGLFWTVPIAAQEQVDLGLGTARYTVNGLALRDFFNIPNAIFHLQSPVSTGAHCSFDVQWTGPVSKRDAVTTPGATGELALTVATMTWSATNDDGFSFVSNPSGTTSAFAQVGKVSNGVFAE